MNPGSLLVFYGTLMGAYPTQDRLGIRHRLEPAGVCLLKGELYDLGWYPGLVAGQRTVRAELYRALDSGVIDILDRFEGYDPADPTGSEYLRLPLELEKPSLTAWVYVYNRPVSGRDLVACDDWASHLDDRRASDPDGWEEFFHQRI
jgi:gamma-glutamylcyclotransferase (GGCT)/AIG2-like uncharacterized protein YtfP